MESSTKLFSALARELKSQLTVIARNAELRQDAATERQAVDSMKLIDSYLLVASSEYGQAQLNFSTINAGSVLYQVEQELKPFSGISKNKLVTVVSYKGPIYTDRGALTLLLNCLARTVCSSQVSERGQEVNLVSFKNKKNHIITGVTAEGLGIVNSELEKSDELGGFAHMPLSISSSESGVRLAIAQQLANSLDSTISAFSWRGKRGLGIEVAKSQQLSLRVN